MKQRGGFTIVELLIVIIVIAILAAITLVAYNGIIKRATEASMQSDLQSAMSLLEVANQSSQGYPTDARTLNDGKGLPQSGSNQTLYLKMGSDNYCIASMNTATSTVYSITSSSGQVTQGGCASAVTLSTPSVQGPGGFGLAIDASGTRYASSTSSIQAITAAGAVSTLAGSGTTGYADGTGAAAKFNMENPNQLAFDLSGNLIATDGKNCVVRRITMSGVVTTIAGIPGNCSSTDGVQGVNTLNRPCGAVVDSAGNIYIAETYGGRVRKLATNGTVSTLASGLTQPNSIGINTSSGNLYVGTTWPVYQVYRVTLAGQIKSPFVGLNGAAGSTDGVGTQARLNTTTAIAVDASGNILVFDAGNNKLKAVTPGGAVFTIAGSGAATNTDGTGLTGTISGQQAMTFDQTGALILTNLYGVAYRKVSI